VSEWEISKGNNRAPTHLLKFNQVYTCFNPTSDAVIDENWCIPYFKYNLSMLVWRRKEEKEGNARCLCRE
jgi:hypothetical protein